MRESCTPGSVRGVLSNEHPYRDRARAVTPAVQRLARRAHVPPVARVGTTRAWLCARGRTCAARAFAHPTQWGLGSHRMTCGRCRRGGCVPWNEHSLEHLDNSVERNPRGREEKDRGKGERGVELLVGDDDEIAEAAVTADDLADDRADDGQRHCDLHAAEQLRQGGGDPKLPEGLPAACLQRVAEVEELGLYRGKPRGAVDHDREEGDQEGHQHLGKEAVAEPDEEEGSNRPFRDELRYEKERHDDIAQLRDHHDDRGAQDPEHHGEQEPGGGLIERGPGVDEIEDALLVQAPGDLAGCGDKEHRDVERAAWKLPRRDQRNEREAQLESAVEGSGWHFYGKVMRIYPQ